MSRTDELIETYLTHRSVFIIEQALEKLVEITNTKNYIEVIHKIERFPKSTEIDISMYINDIAKFNFSELIPIIENRLKVYKDEEAVEELEEAFTKITNYEHRRV